jgi:hypothetical protein
MDKPPPMPTTKERQSGSPSMQRQLALQILHVKHLWRLNEASAQRSARDAGEEEE